MLCVRLATMPCSPRRPPYLLAPLDLKARNPSDSCVGLGETWISWSVVCLLEPGRRKTTGLICDRQKIHAFKQTEVQPSAAFQGSKVLASTTGVPAKTTDRCTELRLNIKSLLKAQVAPPQGLLSRGGIRPPHCGVSTWPYPRTRTAVRSRNPFGR
jgi:hypothetical protein